MTTTTRTTTVSSRVAEIECELRTTTFGWTGSTTRFSLALHADCALEGLFLRL